MYSIKNLAYFLLERIAGGLVFWRLFVYNSMREREGSKEMKVELDCHTHTVSSGHAYSTWQENAHEAAVTGLKLIACTDHAPSMPGGAHPYYFQNLGALPKVYEGVRVLSGAEVNILNNHGDVDLPDPLLRKLEYVVASVHEPCIERETGFDVVTAYRQTMKNHPFVTTIGHPDGTRLPGDPPIDYDALTDAAAQYGVLLEINNHSLIAAQHSERVSCNYRRLLRCCMEKELPVILSSDAHFSGYVGQMEEALRLLEAERFPEELVLNTSADRFITYLQKRRGTFEGGNSRR